jgi:regulatory protein
VLGELRARRALDDARFAENFVSYRAARGQGPARIRQDLKALGIPSELLDSAIAQGADWAGLCRRARVRKFGPQPPGAWAEKARQARFLQYRGFSSDHIRLVLGSDLHDE